MKIFLSKFLKIVLLSSFLLLQNCYIVHVAWGQLDILVRRKSISKILENPNTPENTRKKLEFIENVRDYAENKVSLKVNKTYKYFSQLDRKVLSWNIIASERFALKTKSWKFPIVGEVPYIGYFNYDQAVKKANELRSQGWDVRINEVAAYSTLGWFDDPLVSPQLAYNDWFLAVLLLHECTHATIWFVDDASFNESLASYVGFQGALNYFKEKFGKATIDAMIRNLKKKSGEYKIYARYTYLLQTLYLSKISNEKKNQKRNLLFSSMEKELVKQGYRKELSKTPEDKLNNVDLISYTHYHSGGNYFKYTYRICKQDWNCFFKKIEALKNLNFEDRKKIWRKRYN